jgi:hypothetical protein
MRFSRHAEHGSLLTHFYHFYHHASRVRSRAPSRHRHTQVAPAGTFIFRLDSARLRHGCPHHSSFFAFHPTVLHGMRLLLSILVRITPQYSILRRLFPFYCARALFLFLACFTLAQLLYLHFLFTLFSVPITSFLFHLNHLCALTSHRSLSSL